LRKELALSITMPVCLQMCLWQEEEMFKEISHEEKIDSDGILLVTLLGCVATSFLSCH
jgi:hypothetical protein